MSIILNKNAIIIDIMTPVSQDGSVSQLILTYSHCDVYSPSS